MNLAAALRGRAVEHGFLGRPALVVDERTFTHGEIHDGGARTASLLAALGVGPGDAVLLALPDGVELAWAFLGAVGLGALAVPVDPQLPAADHRALAEDCGAGVVLAPAELADRFDQPVVTTAALAARVVALAPRRPVSIDAGAPAYAQYTSGTTGRPRAAVHRHGDPLVYADAFARPALQLGPDDVVLSVSKMFFAYGLGNSLLFPLRTGARAVVHPGRPSPEDVTGLVARHHVTVLFAVPTFYANLVRHGPPAAGLTSLRVAVSAGERLPPALAERTAHLLGCPVLDSLGTTEVGQAFVAGTLGSARAGTIGRALPPYEVAVRDDAGNDLPAGVTGTLWVRGPTVLVEYLGQPEATAASFDGAWLRTGDRASIDEDGFVSHHGRVDDMEMVGGVTVAPQEVEEVLCTHPAVSEVAVAAVLDGYGASRLRAFVVPAPGVEADEWLRVELDDLARSRLARFKVPRSVAFVDALPRTPTGKLRRFLLRSDPGAGPGGSQGQPMLGEHSSR